MLQCISSAVAEPLSIAQVKQHLGVTHNSDDQHIALLLTSARQYVEQATGRALVDADYILTHNCYKTNFFLPRWPAEITRVYYLDEDNVEQEVTDFRFNRAGYFVNGVCRADNFAVEFSTIVRRPELLNMMLPAILLTVEASYEASPDQQTVLMETVDRMLDSYRINFGF